MCVYHESDDVGKGGESVEGDLWTDGRTHAFPMRIDTVADLAVKHICHIKIAFAVVCTVVRKYRTETVYIATAESPDRCHGYGINRVVGKSTHWVRG